MVIKFLPALAGYIPHDRVQNLLQPETPLATDGVALIADISGFTPLTEALTQGLSPDQGAEELTRALEGVFTPLIEQIHAFRGSVIKFGGDALIVWYGREPRVRRAAVIRRALTSAWRMQQAITTHGQVPTPIGTVTLRMKVGLTYGSIKRFNLGSPEYGYEDVIGGATLDRMAEAEHHAEPGDVMLDTDTVAYVAQAMTVTEWRDDFAVLGQLKRPARPKPWPPRNWALYDQESLKKKFAPYVPPQIHDTLASGRTQVAELKPVVSLFVQFHGIDYDADPDVGAKLQTYFTTAQKVVAGYEGRLNRLITGDKGSLIHVIFGAPRTVEEQEKRAVRCALDLQRACGSLPFISMQRTGIAVGRVFAGPVGSPDRHDYTTMGDSINLSARLMQHAADNQILLDGTVRQRLGPGFNLADLGEIRVKGKAEPIPIFAALNFQSLPAQPKPDFSRRPRPLFGRDEEIINLQQRLADLVREQGGVVILNGDVGMGKTHMLDHLRSSYAPGVTEPGNLTWATGICLAYGQTLAGYLFIGVLRDLLDLPPTQTPAETGQALRHFCADLFGPHRLEATYPYLARFMGLPLEEETAQRLAGLSGESLRWQLFQVMRDLLTLLLKRRPVVLALDDLQWADATSLQLIEALLPLAVDQPLLLLIAMRPEQESRAWPLRARIVEQMPDYALDTFLGPLRRTDSAALIRHTAPQLPQRIVTYLVDKAGGNPLFLVEILRSLQTQGLLADEVNLDHISLDELHIPDSVQSLLLAQIDRLSIEARHTLQMASIIGETFFYRVLDALAAGEKRLAEQLTTLEANKYIQADEPTDLGPAYTFRHILIQESAYGTLLYEHRRAYHRQVAQILERLFPAYVNEQAGLLAFHYERANDLEQATAYHLQAADQARLLYANEEAESLYQKVLQLQDRQVAAGNPADLESRAKTYLKLAQVRANTLDFEGAQRFYNLAFDLLESIQPDNLEDSAAVVDREPTRPLRLGIHAQTTAKVDPGLSEMSDELEIINNLFEGLIELDTELNIIPAQARRWQVDEAGKKYRFELRENLRWSDGTPLTAQDFVFAWRRNLSPETEAPLAPYLYPIRGAEAFHQGKLTDPNLLGIKALDDLNLEVTLQLPTGYFPYLLAHSITYPQPAHVLQARGSAWAQPKNLVCNGAFRFVTDRDNQEHKLEKNPFYRGLFTGNLQQVNLRFLQPNFENYENNQIDLCLIDNRADLPSHHSEELFFAQYLETFYLSFSHYGPPFANRFVREAFAKSINQQDLVKKVWANVQRPARGGMIPPGMIGHSPEIGLSFDPIEARHLLQKGGFDSGHHLPPLILGALPGFDSLPVYLQSSWREHLGVNVQLIEDMSFADIITKMQQGQINLSLIGFLMDYPDPDNILRVMFHGDSPMNYLNLKNKQFDRLIEQALSSTDQKTRLSLYHQADHILVADEIAVVPLYYRQAFALLRTGFKIKNIGKSIRGGMFKLKNISTDITVD